ncbi:unnamed protein product [Caenorhabditis auriculariae]|uniref:Major facilitator superfamily (MFS) profile domain-containing protein n=1 Tax=Caenorhabditis auriculariae TaxID=2777116 RepID=A0A8S1H1E8_9PELO|nr:unnamed protein product [Caenorhabditis auriculariae]
MDAKWRLLLLTALLALSSVFQMGYTNAYPNTAITSFREYLNASHNPPGELSNTEYEWIWSATLNIYFVGFAIGSLCTGIIADRIGRKPTLILGNMGNLVSVVVATVSIAFYVSWMFALSRLIMSFSAAISMNSLILLFQESAPSNLKGIVSFNAEMAFVITNLIGAICGMQGVLGSNLVMLVGLSCIPTLLSVLLSLHLHESPRYLLLRKRDDGAAIKSLRFYQRPDEITAQKTIEEIKKESQNDEKGTSLLTIFQTPHLRKGFLLGVCTMQITTSVWPIVYYSTDFLTRAGSSYELAEFVSTAMLFVSSISTLVGMFLVERLPRKWLLVGCSIVNMSALLSFSLCAMLQDKFAFLTYGCIASLILHGASYSVALGPIAWFITSELMPLSCRALAQSVVLAINHTIALVVSFVSFPLYTAIGPIILIVLFVIPDKECTHQRRHN